MGLHTYTAVLPFVHHNVATFRNDIPDDLVRVLYPDPEENNDPVNGWTYASWEEVGRHKNFLVNVWKKDDMAVYEFDESPYESVGVHKIAVAASNPEWIMKFCEDIFAPHGFKANKDEIFENEAVQQTI